MNAATGELLRRGLGALRRSSTWWAVGIASFVVLNAAFWPSLEGSDTLEGFEDMGALLEAFGAQDIASPAGFLDGQIFALMLPLLLSGMAVAVVTAVTSGDEDAGRLELLHALPVSRSAVWVSRWASLVVMLVAVTAIVALAMVASLRVFSLQEVSIGRVVGATLACALLAAFHGSVGYAAGGFGASRGRAAGIAVLLLVTGYVMSVLLPLADALAGARRWSPWYWAIGAQPVSDGVSGPRLLLLAVATVALVWLGTVGVNRRDIRSA